MGTSWVVEIVTTCQNRTCALFPSPGSSHLLPFLFAELPLPHSPSGCFHLKIPVNNCFSFLWVSTNLASELSQSPTLSDVLPACSPFSTKRQKDPVKICVRSGHTSAENLPVAFYLNENKSWNLLKMSSAPPSLHPRDPSDLPSSLPSCSLCPIYAGPSLSLEPSMQTPTSPVPFAWHGLPSDSFMSVSLRSVRLGKWNILKGAVPNHPI